MILLIDHEFFSIGLFIRSNPEREDLLLRVCRLTDIPTAGRNRNLSVKTLPPFALQLGTPCFSWRARRLSEKAAVLAFIAQNMPPMGTPIGGSLLLSDIQSNVLPNKNLEYSKAVVQALVENSLVKRREPMTRKDNRDVHLFIELTLTGWYTLLSELDAPSINEGQWIKVKSNESCLGIDGYVFNVYSKGCLGVGYYQDQLKSIKQNVVWNGKFWQFQEHLGGSYLDTSDAGIVERGP